MGGIKLFVLFHGWQRAQRIFCDPHWDSRAETKKEIAYMKHTVLTGLLMIAASLLLVFGDTGIEMFLGFGLMLWGLAERVVPIIKKKTSHTAQE